MIEVDIKREKNKCTMAKFELVETQLNIFIDNSNYF